MSSRNQPRFADGSYWETDGNGNLSLFNNHGVVLLTMGTGASSFLQLFDPTSAGARWLKIFNTPGSGTVDDSHFQTSNGTTTIDNALATNGLLKVANGFYLVSSPRSTTPITLANNARPFEPCDASSASIAITLPAANAGSAAGQYLAFVKVDSSVNTVTITAAGSDTIEGGTNKVLTTQYAKTVLISDGGSPGIWYDLAKGLV
ncbi:MAG: hypothetical protein ACREQ5_03605 [Candidatus Dormibacteria bacterium]